MLSFRLFTLVLLVSITSCQKTVDVKLGKDENHKGVSYRVSSISLNDNHLIIEGESLNNIEKVKIRSEVTDPEYNFKIKSITPKKIVLEALQLSVLTIAKIYSVVISEANASETFPISIAYEDNTVSGKQLLLSGKHKYVPTGIRVHTVAQTPLCNSDKSDKYESLYSEAPEALNTICWDYYKAWSNAQQHWYYQQKVVPANNGWMTEGSAGFFSVSPTGNVQIGSISDSPTGIFSTKDYLADFVDGTSITTCPIGYAQGNFDGEADNDDCRSYGMFIFPNGLVGVGTDNPLARLHVKHSDLPTNDSTVKKEVFRLSRAGTDGRYAMSAGFSLKRHELSGNNSRSQLDIIIGQNANDDPTHVVMSLLGSRNVGIDQTSPKSKLQIANGDVYIETISKGLILKSPNGSCFRITVDDSGTLLTDSLTCP